MAPTTAPSPDPTKAPTPSSSTKAASSRTTRQAGQPPHEAAMTSPKATTRRPKRGLQSDESDSGAATGTSSSPSSSTASPPTSSTSKKAKTNGGGASLPTTEVAVKSPPPVAASGKEKNGDEQCKGCSKKKSRACEHHRCINCCEKLGKECKGHEKQLKIRKEEEELLSHPCGAKLVLEARRVFKGDYQEDNFEYIGDTVTIFCLLDFFRNKKWSKETLEQCERSRRAAMARKRDGGGEGVGSPAQSQSGEKQQCRKERWQAKREALMMAANA